MPASETHTCFSMPPTQRQARQRFRAFAQASIAPEADRWDREEAVPDAMIELLREERFLGAPLPRERGGGGMDALTYALLIEELARACSSVRSLLTVHDMVSLAVARWGSAALQRTVLEPLARGARIAALALSEPTVGSDASSVETRARRDGDSYVLDGVKTWITFGQIADEFLVIARAEEGIGAFLVPAGSTGLDREPLRGMVGTRASRLAILRFDGCRVPVTRLVGRIGFGFSHVATTALDHGRFTVALGALGIARACLDACLDHTKTRQQFGRPLIEHQLVQRKLTEMITATQASALLCYRAASLRAAGDPAALGETMIAKYFATRAATRIANDAVHLHGAPGLTERLPLGRYLRDAKVLEIIEGSTEIHQMTIPRIPIDEL